MVALLDDDGKRFLQHGMTSVIQKLADADDETAKCADAEIQNEVEPVANFRFDDVTPNLFGKVVWDTDHSSWKVTHKSGNERGITYKDHLGGDLAVPEDLSGDAFMREKEKLYKMAIATWNEIDKSTRRRLATPLEITIDGSSPSKSESSQELVLDNDEFEATLFE
jgi:hypothetical protein